MNIEYKTYFKHFFRSNTILTAYVQKDNFTHANESDPYKNQILL